MEVAGNDPLKLEAIWKTVPLTDALEALYQRRRRDAEERFRHRTQLYATGGGKKPPELPDILKEPPKRRADGPLKYQAPEKSSWIERLEQEIPPPRRR